MPDSFVCSLPEPDAGDFGGLWDYLLATGFGEALRDDTSGPPASGAEESGGGVSLSIISGRRSPEDELM